MTEDYIYVELEFQDNSFYTAGNLSRIRYVTVSKSLLYL